MTTDNAPVITAQDIRSCFRFISTAYCGFDEGRSHTDIDKTVKNIESLLSRARQEAATAAYSEGRKDGLKEMYMAVSENFNVSQFANKETLKLMSEFPN